MTKVLIIGSNRGIGLELAKQTAARGDQVIGACRKSSAELDALAGVDVRAGIDVTNEDSLVALAKELGEASIDGVVVVAGILESTSLDGLDVDSVRRQFEVNAIGPLVAAKVLAPCIKSGGKLSLLTSRMGSIADNTSGGSYGYRMSKAALNMAGASLAHDLKPRGIAVRLLHPGWVRTEMTRGTGNIDAAECAAGLIERIDELSMDTSGTFVHQNGESLPW